MSRRLLGMLLTGWAVLCLWGTPASAQEIAPDVAQGLEATILTLSFDDLPAFEKDGFALGYRESLFQAEGLAGLNRFDTAAEADGFPIPLYDPAREWIAGQFPSHVIKMGDLLYTGMGIEQLTLDSIAQITGLDIEHFQLAEIPFLGDVTLGELVGSVPFLADYQLTALPGLAQQLGALNSAETLSQVLLNHPAIGDLPVIGDLLGHLQVADLPNLGVTHLGDFPKIGDEVVANVPGLAVIPFGSFPGLALAGGLMPLAKQDIAFENKEYSGEKATPKPISGGTDGGRQWQAIPCKAGCAHIELYDSDISPGKGAWAGTTWMTRAHRVKDGYGLLGSLFSEAGAYRLPFGNAFALQLRSTDEKTGAADWGLAFRICSKGLFFDLGCTAYFLEVDLPITTYEGATILTGIKDGRGGVTEPVAAPEGWKDLKPATPPQLQGVVGTDQPGRGRLCGKGPGGVNYDALAAAYKTIKANIDDDNAIRDNALSVSDMGRLRSREEQHRLFKTDQEKLIKQAMSEGFEGSELIERVGELHTGGIGAPVGVDASYSRRLSTAYQEQLKDTDCGKATGQFINPNPKGVFTSPFGMRSNPVTGEYKMHDGIDLASPKGTPGAAILATDGGVVIKASWHGGYGNYVEIDHGGGTKSWYAHLSVTHVKVGDPVQQGEAIGAEGTTGNSTGVHLHFGLEINGQLVDPARYIPL